MGSSWQQQRLLISHRGWAFPPRDSPSLRALLPRLPVVGVGVAVGLLCVWGVLVGLFPASLGFSTLLLHYTETLLLLGLKELVLLTRADVPPSPDKQEGKLLSQPNR